MGTLICNLPLTYAHLQDGMTALMMASKGGHAAIVTLLLEVQGISVNQVMMLACIEADLC
jgi:ankyrin repeat protein